MIFKSLQRKKWGKGVNQDVLSIQKLNPNNYIESLKMELQTIDLKITSITKELLNAQAITITSALSTNRTFLGNLRRRFYSSAAKDSISWHLDRLQILNRERDILQIRLDKATGQYWSNRLKRWVKQLVFILIAIMMLWIIFMGFITALYLLPIWGSILLAYWIIQQKK